MGFYRGPNLVTNGLVVSLDAGNTKSYTSGSTTWLDKSGYVNNGTLVNGPGFNSQNGGSIVFDGVNDYVTGSLQNSSLYTLGIWVKITTYTVGGGLLAGGASEIYLQLGGGSTWQFLNAYSAAVPVNLGQWTYVVGIRNSTLDSIYVNGSFVISAATTGTSLGTSYIIGQRRVGGICTNCNVGISQIYNRALTAQEVLQNYNATKSRFNL